MITTIQRWGNSLAVRIPKAFAAQAELTEDTQVQIAIENDAIVIRPAPMAWKLDDMLASVTAANRHSEVEWGDRVGKESW